MRYRVLNTWNGGAGGVVEEFRSAGEGDAALNECFAWILNNTPFSYYEATTHQGYRVEPCEGEAP
jgi:hypothetical protein